MCIWRIGMSKTYWLVSSNGIPEPTKKDNQLFLGDVNARDVVPLKRSERYNYLYYVKNIDESILDNVVIKKHKFKNRIQALAMLPNGLKAALAYLMIYFISYFVMIYLKNELASIYIAFMAFISTMLISFTNYFKSDKIFGPTVTLLAGAIAAKYVAQWYLKTIEINTIMQQYMGKENIGNLLTILSVMISFHGYIDDIIMTYQHELYISKIK